jgi:hypothetical protein
MEAKAISFKEGGRGNSPKFGEFGDMISSIEYMRYSIRYQPHRPCQEKKISLARQGYPKTCVLGIRRFRGVAWRGFRDVLIHDYFGVDLAAMWEITQKDLPKLKVSIEKILAETGNDES